MRIRIKDIADQAGVSVGTVDRVIHKRGNVSPAVKEKVEKVMTQLGYRRNIIASTLALNRTLRISVLLFDNKDYFWEQTRLGIEKAQDATHHYGVEVSILYCENPGDFRKKTKQILDSRPDAIMFAPLYKEEGLRFIEECHNRSIPTVLINTQLDAPDTLCYIGQDSYQSGVVAARLIHFGIPDHSSALLLNLDSSAANAQHLMDKERGFRDYFNEIQSKSVHVYAANFEHEKSQNDLRNFLSGVFEAHPDLRSIFVTNSRAYRVVECLKEDELEKLFIVGFDLIEPNIRHLKSNRINFLINQNPTLQGYLGVLNIVNHILLKKDVTPIQYLPLDIVVVENCEYYVNSDYAFPAVV